MAVDTANIGRTRERLARMLEELFPGYEFPPERLGVQNPVFIRYYGCARWWGWGFKRQGAEVKGPKFFQVTSWDRMRDCVRYGIEAGDYDETIKEISQKPEKHK